MLEGYELAGLAGLAGLDGLAGIEALSLWTSTLENSTVLIFRGFPIENLII